MPLVSYRCARDVSQFACLECY